MTTTSKKRVKQPTYKSREVKTTVSAAIGDAFSEFQSLAEEMRETADNMEGANMTHMPKYEVASTAADELENHTDEPDVTEAFAELPVTATEMYNRSKRKANSRSVRLSNAQGLIQAARDALEAHKETLDAGVEISDNDAKVDEKEGAIESQKEEIDSLVQGLDEHCEFDVDFPGFYG